ncbi:unnamed protein product [Allacma fusca]|uniref:Uncharacterized protein n=1 Tax=Allacma fusca TaxID=39272 RepID=A0A8J2PB02_9HEXA|nr:unnamed protein product [Allacma fusca]
MRNRNWEMYIIRSFCDRIQPPSRFSDSRDLSDGDEHEMGLMVGELTTTTIPSSSLITTTTQDSRLPINFGSMKRAHNKSRHPPPVPPSSIHPQQQQQQRKGQTYHIDV